MNEKMDRRKKNIYEIIYFMILTMLITKNYTSVIFNMVLQKKTSIVGILYIAFLTLTFLKIVIGEITRKDKLLTLITLILIVISGEHILIIPVGLAIASKCVDDENIVKYYLIISIVLFISVILMKNLGILPESPMIHYRTLSSGERVQRYDFGLGNPNTVFIYLMPIYLAYIYLRFEKYNMIDRIILLATSIYFYDMTKSRTGFIVMLITIVLVDLFKIIDFKKNKILTKIIIYTPWIILICSILVGTIFSNNEILNNLLTGRANHWNYYLNNMNFIGWGKINSNHPLDSSYIYMISICGLPVTITILTFISYCLSKCIIDNKKLALITISFLICAFSENIIFNNSINFAFIILLKRYILKYNELEKIKKE